MLKCDKCGFEGSRNEFGYVGLAQEIGAVYYRRCPSCTNLVVCDEMEEDEKSDFTDVWGLSRMRGKIFKGKERRGKKNEV